MTSPIMQYIQFFFHSYAAWIYYFFGQECLLSMTWSIAEKEKEEERSTFFSHEMSSWGGGGHPPLPPLSFSYKLFSSSSLLSNRGPHVAHLSGDVTFPSQQYYRRKKGKSPILLGLPPRTRCHPKQVMASLFFPTWDILYKLVPSPCILETPNTCLLLTLFWRFFGGECEFQ